MQRYGLDRKWNEYVRKRQPFLIQLLAENEGGITQFRGTVKFIRTGWCRAFSSENEVTAIMKEFLARFSSMKEAKKKEKNDP